MATVLLIHNQLISNYCNYNATLQLQMLFPVVCMLCISSLTVHTYTDAMATFAHRCRYPTLNFDERNLAILKMLKLNYSALTICSSQDIDHVNIPIVVAQR
jgi:hypothetical protein